jgi:acid phosphatase (class A)
MLQIQNSRTPEMVAQAKADQQESVFRFADVLGPDFIEEKLPLTSGFFKRVHHAEGDLVDPLKDYWKKPRPPQVDSRIKPCIDLPWNYSYPSGHATGGTAMSILLAHMVPEKKDALLARGVAFGENRVIGGVHFPSDVVAGRIAGALLAENILRDPTYQKDYEAALLELRKALGLPPLP